MSFFFFLHLCPSVRRLVISPCCIARCGLHYTTVLYREATNNNTVVLPPLAVSRRRVLCTTNNNVVPQIRTKLSKRYHLYCSVQYRYVGGQRRDNQQNRQQQITQVRLYYVHLQGTSQPYIYHATPSLPLYLPHSTYIQYIHLMQSLAVACCCCLSSTVP